MRLRVRDDGLYDLVTFGLCTVMDNTPEKIHLWMCKFYAYQEHQRSKKKLKKRLRKGD